MTDRLLITTIDSLAALLVDHLNLPSGGKPVRLSLHPATRLLAIELEADEPIYPLDEIVVSYAHRLVIPVH